MLSDRKRPPPQLIEPPPILIPDSDGFSSLQGRAVGPKAGRSLSDRISRSPASTNNSAIDESPSNKTRLELPCPACGSPREAESRFCIACGLPFEVPDNSTTVVAPGVNTVPVNETQASIPVSRGTSKPSVASDPTGNRGRAVPSQFTKEADHSQLFHCQNCGSDIETSASDRSFRCPFCDSAYVAEIDPATNKRQRPEFVIGFSITKDQAEKKYLEWIGKNSLFRPGDLNLKAVSEKQKGVYIPFWHFSVTVDSNWSARIGEYWYRTETYYVTNKDGKREMRTRTVRETEWWPLSGKHHKYYSGFLVSGSLGLPQQEALAIQPYNLNALVRYRPYFLAGWFSEEYSVSLQDALEVAKDEFRKRQARSIEQNLPGDTHSGLQISTDVDMAGSDLILLPVHILTYRYQNQTYHFLVNGQTGKVYGEKPWSAVRIGIAVAIGLLLLIGIVILILISTQVRR